MCSISEKAAKATADHDLRLAKYDVQRPLHPSSLHAFPLMTLSLLLI